MIGVGDAGRCQNKVVTIYLSVFGHLSQKVGGKFNTISLHSVLFRTLFSTKDKIGIHFVLGCRLSSYLISSFRAIHLYHDGGIGNQGQYHNNKCIDPDADTTLVILSRAIS